MDHLTTTEAAALLGIDAATVQKLCKRGRLPAIKAGRDWLIHRKDVEKAKKRPKPGRPRKPKP